MKDLLITHRGEYSKDGITYSNDHQSHLLLGEDGFESIVEIIEKGTIGYLYTIHDGSGIDFNYILKGKVEFRCGQETQVLIQGDTFSHHAIKENIMFRVIEDTEFLSISTVQYYDYYQEDQEHLNDVLNRLQEIDGDTKEHCLRVKKLSMGIAYFMHYNESSLEDLFFAANFHDVGKAKIPPEILLKPGKLTDEEYEIMKKHSTYTYEMIKDYYGEMVAEIAYGHHERLDGRGYPRGIRADQISLPSRIICVADAYDAMTVTRPYHKGLSQKAALAELHRCEGTQFDGIVIQALEEYLNETDK